jgi:hypothetical protein
LITATSNSPYSDKSIASESGIVYFLIDTPLKRRKNMSKSQNSKKTSKKEPAKTMNEKKIAKRIKKEAKKNLGLQQLT